MATPEEADRVQQWVDNLEDLTFTLPVAEPVWQPIALEDIAPRPLGTVPDQLGFVDCEEPWKAEWQGMPEFHQENLAPHRTLYVHFATPEDVAAFFALVGQPYTPETQYLWFPNHDKMLFADKRWVDTEEERP